MASLIEDFVKTEMEKAIKNHNFASKAWVKEQLQIYNRPEIKNKEYTINYSVQCNAPSGKFYTKWSEDETTHLKNTLNIFLKQTADFYGRSPAGVKAKLFRLLQESYQKI